MGKPCQLYAIFLAEQSLIMSAFFDVVYLNRLVAVRGHAQLAIVIVVDRLHVRRRLAFLDVLALKELYVCQPGTEIIDIEKSARTFVGLYEEMTSLSADVGGPVNVRWMLSDGVETERAGPSTSIGVEDMLGNDRCLQKVGIQDFDLGERLCSLRRN